MGPAFYENTGAKWFVTEPGKAFTYLHIKPQTLKSHLHEVCWVSNHNLHGANPTPTTAQVVHFVAVISLFQKKAPEISCSSDFQAVRVTCGCLG